MRAAAVRFHLFFLVLILGGPSARQDAISLAETITLDGRGPGRTFEGLGVLSAGANSRLLFDYPEPQRGQLLDLLFKPNFGAGVQHLKVEIGGDVNSTWGSEPSYARTREEFEHPRPEYFDRGYEWWLMREAKKRNPNICLDILQWGAPDWIGEKDFPDAGDPNLLTWDKRKPRNQKKFYTQDNADFIVEFIRGAKRYHGLDVNYCGIWNETPPLNAAWIKLLRRTLDRRGLSAVGIVADDCWKWTIVDALLQDAELRSAVAVVGNHYPVGGQTTPAAQQCGKRLWASEDNTGWAATDKPGGGGPGVTPLDDARSWREALTLARKYNHNYITGKITKTIICPAIDSFYDNLIGPNLGPIKANTPWSGHYEVWRPLWAIAHTCQFAQPGWRYIDAACGVLEEGGSYVGLRSDHPGGHWSIIIETADAKKTQSLSFRVSGGLSAGTVHVWRSSVQSQLERRDDIHPVGNLNTLSVDPGCIYSLTTTTGQQKGKTEIPPAAEFPVPYRDDFESYAAGKMARYFSDQGGTFEVACRPDGGKCLRQTVARRPIDWWPHPTPEPCTLIGSDKWRDYEVACDAQIEKTGYVAVFGRIKQSPFSRASPPHGYWLTLAADGRWELKAFTKTLKSGTVPPAADRWHRLALRFSGSQIIGKIDSVEFQLTDEGPTRFDSGMAGLGSGWNNARFDNFSVRGAADR